MAHRLVVMRHAKSQWPDGVADHDRPLEERGVRDAKAAGEWLRDHVGTPDHVIVSTARRARGTWTLAAGPLGYIGAAGYETESPGALTIDPRVYDASLPTLFDVLREIPERVGTTILVGHNPGSEDLVSTLASNDDSDPARLAASKYPTCGIAVLTFTVPWSELTPKSAELIAFAVPRG